MSSPLLPRVSRVRLTGYAPLFREPIEFSVPDSPGPFVILGANTLGKTTIVLSNRASASDELTISIDLTHGGIFSVGFSFICYADSQSNSKASNPFFFNLCRLVHWSSGEGGQSSRGCCWQNHRWLSGLVCLHWRRRADRYLVALLWRYDPADTDHALKQHSLLAGYAAIQRRLSNGFC